MKVIVCNVYGLIDGLIFVDLFEFEVIGLQVVIKVVVIGVNYFDGFLVQGLYQVKFELFFILGMEMVGIIESVGLEVKCLKFGMCVVVIVGIGVFV